ncbi:MAG: hypothetical protein JNN27_02615 [Planctomycetes bacterium]|nr:hypothetical protein [Planctomycetota bacterium]
MDIHLNSEPVKYALLLLTLPFWLPFAKALWTEFNDSLRDEGGLLGAAPTPEELAAIERTRGRFQSSMRSVTREEQARLENSGWDGASDDARRTQRTTPESAGGARKRTFR